MTSMGERGRILVLWNQVEEDIYERWREEGPKRLAWDPTREVPDVGTVAEEMAALIKAIRDGGFHVDLVNVMDDLDRVIGAIRLYKPDAVFNLVEYFNDDAVQEAYIGGIYEILGVPYTGNRPIPLATCQNKFRTKLILEAAGIDTAPFFIVRNEPVPTDHGLAFPLIVKPALEDASGGIDHGSVVQDQAALEARVRHVLTEFEMPALVESYIEGREIHVAVLGNDPPECLPLFEMDFDDSEFNPNDEWRPQIISFRAKWDPHSKDFYSMDAVCPAEELSPELEEYIRETALAAYQALGCRDYARVDMRVVEEEGEVFILEVNPNPDLIDGTAFVQCAVASGRTYSEVMCEIAEMPIKRQAAAEALWEKARAADQAGLPTDHLLREWAAAKQGRAVEGQIDAPKSRPAPATHKSPADAVEGEVSDADLVE
jgi:D-alanine-D-alanine ligase